MHFQLAKVAVSEATKVTANAGYFTIMPLALTGSSTSVKDKRDYKEVQELLLLHRRYEEKALRLFRKGLSDEAPETARQSRAQSVVADTPLNNGSTKAQSNLKKYSPKSHRENLTKPLYLNDKDYLKQLLLKSDANGNFVDRSESNWNGTTNTRAQLRLPKLESIPPENKEIFYTTLPKMPPLPKLKEAKVKAIKPQRKKKRSRHNSRDESSTFSSETCLTIRQLPRDHFMLHDFGNGTNSSSSISTVPTFPRITPSQEIELSSKAITTDEGCLWLVPFVNIQIPPYRLAKWNELENGSLPAAGDKRKDLEMLKAGAGSDNRTIGDSRPKYKRNVHFSEFLHEIHLYSPIATAQSAKSREDVNGH